MNKKLTRPPKKASPTNNSAASPPRDSVHLRSHRRGRQIVCVSSVFMNGSISHYELRDFPALT